MTTWKEHKAQLMKNVEFKEAYDALEVEYNLADELIALRLKLRLTQEELAARAGVSRTVITRLESGTSNPTMATVSRVASALGGHITLTGA